MKTDIARRTSASCRPPEIGALCFASILSLNRRDPERAQNQLETAVALAAEQRLAFPMGEPGMLQGAAFLGQGSVGEAISRIRNGITEGTGLGRTILLPYGFAFLAEGLARRGDLVSAQIALRRGLASADATGQHFWDAELHRLTGTVLLAKNKQEEGQSSLLRAINVAQMQQAKSLELRATLSLARFWGEQGQRAEAIECVGARIDRRLRFPSQFGCQRIRAETGMPRPVIRLSTLHPTFASVR
jgi:predicted ATPase